jgi:Tfp pilus assembly protein PilF
MLLLASSGASHMTLAAPADSGVIRLRPAEQQSYQGEASPHGDQQHFEEARRGFDYEAFEAQLESLWFQRKAYLADGRESDADDQSKAIRAFCAEEGIKRLEDLAGALVAESYRYLQEGRYNRALDSLDLAQVLDPGRPQTHLARAAVLFEARRGYIAAAAEFLRAVRSSLFRSIQDLSLFNRLALVVLVALLGIVLIFSLLMLIRYQIPFRHEIEEWAVQVADDRVAQAMGWAVLFLPMLLWVGTGWAALYWIAITFRFMRRGEKVAAVGLLAASILATPAYRMAVTIYGMTADPVVRTTLASAGGEYDPDRILKLRQLVQAYPDDPSYRFLLAGLYKNGRYYEEAFAEYKQALALDPAFEQVHINLGNIFYDTRQYAEALASYRRALEVNPSSILAYFNMHLAQSESFKFKGADESLNRARDIDSARLAAMLTEAGARGDRATVIDASLKMTSVWQAALVGGRPQRLSTATASPVSPTLLLQLVNPISLAAALALVFCGVALVISRGEMPARRCIRCGRPFCHYCKSGQEGHEYCSQCFHLYVLGDGLAPETKTRKLYEVERYERLSRGASRLISILLPGSAHLLRGRAATGSLLLLAWLAALIAWQPVLLRPVEMIAGVDLRLELLAQGSVPAMYGLDPSSWLALLTLPLIWLAGNSWRRKRREA